MQQEALLLKGLSGNDTMQDLPLLTPDPPQQAHTRPTLNDFRIHSQQQERLMCLMWAHWEVTDCNTSQPVLLPQATISACILLILAT